MLTEQTRYRITGAVFLAAVAAIVLPMLFDGQGIEGIEGTGGAEGIEGVEGMQRTRGLDGTAGTPVNLPPVEPAPLDLRAVADAPPPPDSSNLLAARDELRAEIDPEGYRRETGTRLGDPVLTEADATPTAPAEAWAVQLGSFSEWDRAVALRNRLREDGYDALLSSVKHNAEKLTRVAVGPMLERDAAERLRKELGERYPLDPRVVRFSP